MRIRNPFFGDLLLVFAVFSFTPARQLPAADFDVILRGGTVYDGSGDPAIVADVAIRGDRIAAIGELSDRTADQVLDVRGLAVAPGFINMLSWAVDSLIRRRPIRERYSAGCHLGGFWRRHVVGTVERTTQAMVSGRPE